MANTSLPGRPHAGDSRAKALGTCVFAICICAFAHSSVPPYGKFEDGMLSHVRPAGWLETACRVQAEGLTGHPEALSYPYDSCLWAGEIAREGKHGDGWWRYEQTGYYTDGLLRLGYALADRGFSSKGERGVDWTLEHASPEGYLGNPCLWDTSRFNLVKGYEMWPMAVFFRVMKAKYDATGDERIPPALAKYFLLYEPAKISEGRNVVNVEGMVWTYGKTGDRRLLERAESAWSQKTFKDDWSCDLTPQVCANDKPIYMHGVSYCEEMKIPLLLYAYTGRGEYLEQAANVERKLCEYHMLPDGCPSSTEQTRGNCVHWGHETCVVSDWTWTLGYFLETTGDAQFADKIERCVFNAGFGSVDNDFRALQYFSNVNQFIATADSNHNPYFYGSTWAQYRPTHETECCAGNMHRFLPNYVSRMWLKDSSGAPVAALYGPSSVDFGWGSIREETDYPFDGRVVFRFSLAEPRNTAFRFRVPGWCRGATVKVNGELQQEVPAPGSFGEIRRTFADGDTVELDFPMDVAFEALARCRYVVKDAASKWVGALDGPGGSQGTVVRRGPLLFAHPIAERRSEDVVEHANMRGKKSANPDFKCWDILPAGPFNYALAGRTAEVVRTQKPGFSSVVVKVPARRIKWELDGGKMTPRIPEAIEPVGSVEETLELVPYGATALRLAAFPDLVR